MNALTPSSIRRLALVLLALAALAALAAPAARADAFGELGRVGAFEGAGVDFHYPDDLAVDPSDNSAFVVDAPGAEGPGPGVASFRIQKFSSALAKVAEASVATPAEGNFTYQFVTATAVDPVLHRLYVLVSRFHFGERTCARIVAFSTEGTGTLPNAPDVPEAEVATGVHESVYYSFPAPGQTGALFGCQGLAVDPATHDLIVLGGTTKETRNVLQRIHAEPGPHGEYASGTLTGNLPATVGSSYTGVAVGPDSTIYLITNLVPAAISGNLSGKPGVVSFSPAFTEPHVLFESPTSAVAPPTQAPRLIGGQEGVSDFGPQLAASPEAGDPLVYATETNRQEEFFSEPAVEGNYQIIGRSALDGSQRVLFGGGTETLCRLGSAHIALAAGSGGVLYALDEGSSRVVEENEEEIHQNSAYGFDLVKFGPGGSHCPDPRTSFTVGSSDAEEVTLHKGSEATFEASTAELQGAAPKGLEWNFGDRPPAPAAPELPRYEAGESAEEKAEKEKEEKEELAVYRHHVEEWQGRIERESDFAVTEASHRYLATGTYTVGLDMSVVGTLLGEAEGLPSSSTVRIPRVTKTVHVVPATPLAAFTPSSASPLAGSSVTFDATASEDPAGGACTQTGGCEPTHTLKKYIWDFGDGTPVEETTSPRIEHVFENTSGAPLERTVSLTVESEEGATSAATTRQLSVGLEPVLEVERSGPGEVTSSPTGIDCGEDLCSAGFDGGQTVTLTATPSAHHRFAGWSGGGADPGTCTGATTPCEVTMDESRTLTATFATIEHRLTVDVSGSGAGEVTSDPASISCTGGTCEAELDEPTLVTLTAGESGHSYFAGWSGDCSGTAPTCEVTMDQARSVGAIFTAIAAPVAKNEAPGSPTETGVELKGSVDNKGAPGETECSFEVTKASDPTFSAPIAEPACDTPKVGGEGPRAVTATVTGLTADTNYLYRVKAVSAGGESVASPAQAFTTAAKPAPTCATDPALCPPSGGGGEAGGPGSPGSGSSPGSGAPGGGGGSRPEGHGGTKPSPLARCRKLHGKARARCIRRAHRAKHRSTASSRPLGVGVLLALGRW